MSTNSTDNDNSEVPSVNITEWYDGEDSIIKEIVLNIRICNFGYMPDDVLREHVHKLEVFLADARNCNLLDSDHLDDPDYISELYQHGYVPYKDKELGIKEHFLFLTLLKSSKQQYSLMHKTYKLADNTELSTARYKRVKRSAGSFKGAVESINTRKKKSDKKKISVISEAKKLIAINKSTTNLVSMIFERLNSPPTKPTIRKYLQEAGLLKKRKTR